ncbi:endocuticle structural protein SgAbd-6 [Drosophila mojavensis]|uniref:endocuticle structural protein SgAbd-6 n=1 Tax=Drosophila mojavensis TaxID=7230 RepID=UPI001CD07277|nr:endocuticle structural protein SgAbd-6 [Drosophila mojavensis]
MIRPKMLGLIILMVSSICIWHYAEALPSGSKSQVFGNSKCMFRRSYETIDGISRQETAELKHAGTGLEAIAVQGSIHWVEPNGVHYELSYLADENGFQSRAKQQLPKSDPITDLMC